MSKPNIPSHKVSEDSKATPTREMRFIDPQAQNMMNDSVLNRLPKDRVSQTPERSSTDELMDQARSWFPNSFYPLPSRENSYAPNAPRRDGPMDMNAALASRLAANADALSRSGLSGMETDMNRTILNRENLGASKRNGTNDKNFPRRSTSSNMGPLYDQVTERLKAEHLATASNQTTDSSKLNNNNMNNLPLREPSWVRNQEELNKAISGGLNSVNLDLLDTRSTSIPSHPSTESAMRYVESLRSAIPFTQMDSHPYQAQKQPEPSAAEMLMRHRLLSQNDQYRSQEEELMMRRLESNNQRNSNSNNSRNPLAGSALLSEFTADQIMREMAARGMNVSFTPSGNNNNNINNGKALDKASVSSTSQSFKPRNFLSGNKGPDAINKGAQAPAGGLNAATAAEILAEERLMSLERLSSLERLHPDDLDFISAQAFGRERSWEANNLGHLVQQDIKPSMLGLGGAQFDVNPNSGAAGIPRRNFLAPNTVARVSPTVSDSQKDAKLGSKRSHELSEDAQAGAGGDAAALQTVKRFKPYHEDKWNENFQIMLDYKKEHGNCLVPHTYPPNPLLARWVKRQRRQYKLYLEKNPNSTMTPKRIEKLNAEGFVWDSHEITWMSKYFELVEYRKTNGHCRVPSCSKIYPQLATWVKCQRRQFRLKREGKSSAMTDRRIELLNKIEFSWEVRSQPEDKTQLSAAEASQQLLKLHKM